MRQQPRADAVDPSCDNNQRRHPPCLAASTRATVFGTVRLRELLDAGGDSGWHSVVLQYLRNGKQEVAQLLLPRLVGWLEGSGSRTIQLPHSRSNDQKLSQVVGVLRVHAGPEIKRPLEELAAAHARVAGTGPYLLFWLPVLFSLAPLRGVESMLPVLAALPVEPNGAAVHIIGSLFNQSTGSGSTDCAANLAPTQLLWLTLEFHRHVRPEDDLVHETVYSPRGAGSCRERAPVHLRCAEEGEWTGGSRRKASSRGRSAI